MFFEDDAREAELRANEVEEQPRFCGDCIYYRIYQHFPGESVKNLFVGMPGPAHQGVCCRDNFEAEGVDPLDTCGEHGCDEWEER